MRKYRIIVRIERDNESIYTGFTEDCKDFKEANHTAIMQVKRYKSLGFKCRITSIVEL